MRILHVIPGLTHDRGGPSAVLHALARHQAEAGHEVRVLTTDQGERSGERPLAMPDAASVRKLEVWGTDRLAYAPGFTAAARAEMQSSDVVHVHSVFTYPVHAALREARRAGVPAVVRPCGNLDPACLRRSRGVKRAYLALWGGFLRDACAAWHYTSTDEAAGSWPGEERPYFILPNGIDPEEFAVPQAEARLGVRRTVPQLGDAPYVLFLGRLHPIKRVDLLLEAFLEGAPRGFKLVVAGPDECGLWDSLAARHLRRPRREQVIRIGMVSGREKVDLLAAARVLALCSEHENLGLTVLEALAAGTPALLSPHVGLAGAVQSAGVGEVVPLQVEAWAQRFGTLDPDKTPAEAGRARDWAREHYSWRRIAGELSERYRWVRAGCPAAPQRGEPVLV